MSGPSSPQLPVTGPAPRARGVLAASILCWLAGTGTASFACAEFISEIQHNPMAGLIVVVYPVSALYCLAGYFLYKPSRVGGWLAVITAGLVSAVELLHVELLGFDSPDVELLDSPELYLVLCNLAVILLVVLNWRHLRPSGEVGA